MKNESLIRQKFDHYLKYQTLGISTLSIMNLPCHHHPLQAANCCRNSRLVVNEDDLMWFKN